MVIALLIVTTLFISWFARRPHSVWLLFAEVDLVSFQTNEQRTRQTTRRFFQLTCTATIWYIFGVTTSMKTPRSTISILSSPKVHTNFSSGLNRDLLDVIISSTDAQKSLQFLSNDLTFTRTHSLDNRWWKPPSKTALFLTFKDHMLARDMSFSRSHI